MIRPFSVFFIFLAMVLGDSFVGDMGSVAIAADEKSYKTRKAMAMSQPVFKKLQAAQQKVDEKDYRSAQKILEGLRLRRKKLSVYESAQSWNLTGFTFYLQEKYGPAIDAYEQVLKQGELPEALVQSTLKTMSQLYFVTEQYEDALETVKRLIKVLKEPSADIYMLLGQAFFQLKQYENALAPINQAIVVYEKLGRLPKEQWLLLLRVIYHQKDDFKNMRAVLERMVELYPKDRHLYALAGVYSELGDTEKQLTIMEALYQRDYKQGSSQILNLANLYLLHGIPYKAAKVLDEGLNKSKRIKPSESNFRLLSQAWFQAREDELSIPPMRRAALLSESGELYVRIAQSYQNLDRWQEAETALKSALKKGGLKRLDSAQLMLGVALFNQNKLEEAEAYFELALSDKRSKKSAAQWIKFIRSELRRKKIMASSLS